MNQSEIIAANRASEAEQVERDERNEVLKAEMRADELLSRPAPKHFLSFQDDTKEDFLREIEAENVKQSRQ